MCHQGCRYEISHCAAAGECGLPSDKTPPVDAMCSINELRAENTRLRKLVRDMFYAVHPLDLEMFLTNVAELMIEVGA